MNVTGRLKLIYSCVIHVLITSFKLPCIKEADYFFELAIRSFEPGWFIGSVKHVSSATILST